MRVEPKAAGALLPLLAIAPVVALALIPTTAMAAAGGLEANSSRAQAAPTQTQPSTALSECPDQPGGVLNGSCARFKKARLFDGTALAPPTAPPAVRETIEAANRIRTKPYIWGGGHGSWQAAGYDCSGSVSFALHGGGFLNSPLVSGDMMHWGRPGRGRWITVYANPEHAFAVIDGLRWDTVGDSHGTGPRWHRNMVSTAGFVARHPPGY
jgi:cell wall-associated NlpC family hydrolase